MQSNLVDTTFGVKTQARAILQYLSGREPAFAKYDRGYYMASIDTRPWYNGRETGVALVMEGKDGNRLVVTFGEVRTSDSIFVDRWETNDLTDKFNSVVTAADFPEAAYKNSRKTFRPGYVGDAADYIYGLLEEYYEKNQEK